MKEMAATSFIQHLSLSQPRAVAVCSCSDQSSTKFKDPGLRGNAIKIFCSSSSAPARQFLSAHCHSHVRHPPSRGPFSSHAKERKFMVMNVAGLPRDRTDAGDMEAQLRRELKEARRSSKISTQDVFNGNEFVTASSAQLPNLEPEDEKGQAAQEDEVYSSTKEQEDIELEGYRMTTVCDRLIDVFSTERPKSEEWRKLLAFSEEWSKIRPHFFRRCKHRAGEESDPKKKGDLLKLARRLKEVDDDMERHNNLLSDVEENSLDLDTVVARRRKDFTGDFFEHLQLLSESSYKNLERRDEIASMAAKCLAAVEAYDRAAEDNEALSAAQLKFDDILTAPSLEAACNKIDELARKKELDSTLMLLITKAWAAAKESSMMKEEVKDIMYHLYMVARGNMQRLVPKEVRIIRYILAIEDPRERLAALTDAFSPGDELEGKDIDHLYTTPDKLYKWIKTVLDAYYLNKQSTLIESARQLMNPMVISRLEFLKETMEDQFL